MENNRKRRSRKGRGEYKRQTAEQRAEWARERRAMIGKLITQSGFEGCLVVEHIRGSQYVIRRPDGVEVFASHKKQKDQGSLSAAGWSLWEDRR